MIYLVAQIWLGLFVTLLLGSALGHWFASNSSRRWEELEEPAPTAPLPPLFDEAGLDDAWERAVEAQALAAEADRRAMEAQARAAIAETAAAEAGGSAAEAEARAAEADARAAEAEAVAVEAEVRSEDAEARARTAAEIAATAQLRAVDAEERAQRWEDKAVAESAARHALVDKLNARKAELDRLEAKVAKAVALQDLFSSTETPAADASGELEPAPEPPHEELEQAREELELARRERDDALRERDRIARIGSEAETVRAAPVLETLEEWGDEVGDTTGFHIRFVASEDDPPPSAVDSLGEDGLPVEGRGPSAGEQEVLDQVAAAMEWASAAERARRRAEQERFAAVEASKEQRIEIERLTTRLAAETAEARQLSQRLDRVQGWGPAGGPHVAPRSEPSPSPEPPRRTGASEVDPRAATIPSGVPVAPGPGPSGRSDGTSG